MGLFGSKPKLTACFTVVYGSMHHLSDVVPSQLPYEHSYCFTNHPGNEEIAKELQNKNWQYFYLAEPLHDGLHMSIVKGMRIKCLQFPEEYRRLLDKYSYWIYLDYRFVVKPETLTISMTELDDHCLVAYNPRDRNSIWEEYQDLIKEEPFSSKKNTLRDYIQQKERDYNTIGRVLSTQFMVYHLNSSHKTKTLQIAKEWCDETGSMICPAPTISFFFLTQKYYPLIKMIYRFGENADQLPYPTPIQLLDPKTVIPSDLITITVPIDRITYGVSTRVINVTIPILLQLRKKHIYHIKISNFLTDCDPAPRFLKQLIFYLHDGTQIALNEHTQHTLMIK